MGLRNYIAPDPAKLSDPTAVALITHINALRAHLATAREITNRTERRLVRDWLVVTAGECQARARELVSPSFP